MSNNGTLVRNLTRGGSGGGATSNSNIPFSIKSANIGDKGEVDIFNISKIVNSGCSFTGSVATGGSGKYVRLLETAPISTADSWVINVPKYTYNGGGSSYRTIIGMSSSLDFKTPALLVDNSDILKFYASSDGGSWNIFSAQSTGVTLTAETAYWFRISFSSTTGYKIEYSTNGTDYTEAWTSATTTKSYCAMPFMFLNNGEAMDNGYAYGYSSGTMDFATGSIVIDGTTWWTGNLNNTLSFKVDDGTSYAPLKVINPSGEEVTFTSISALDLSGFADGIINIFATATGVEARQNKIFMQTAEPTAENDGDVWINGNIIKDWSVSGSEWVTSTVIGFLGSVIKNGLIENGYCSPLNYNGKSEINCLNYVNGDVEFDIIARAGFKFYGRYKNYLESVYGSPTYYPTLFFAFYDNSYSGFFGGSKTVDTYDETGTYNISKDRFAFLGAASKKSVISLSGYLTK